MSSAARQASAAVRAAAGRADSDPARPGFHFRPPSGWMNDPNGTIWHRGRCHLFYQHNPYGDRWGDIHWGHAVSRDLVRWEHRPVALAPSRDDGEAHCFTGSAWWTADGEPMLVYTSVAEAPGGRPNEQWAVHCDDDLTSFRSSDANPVLDLAGHGGPAFRDDWRDPFVFGEDGRTFLLLGAVRREDGAPVVALYEAEDGTLLRWRYRGLPLQAEPSETAFFECPNLLRVGDEHLLVVSAHRPVEYRAGRFAPDAGPGELFATSRRGRLDHGAGFYATGRVAGAPGDAPVIVGWVRGWSPDRGWNGALGLPRVLSRGPGGHLRQSPVPAVATLRKGEGDEARDRALAETMRVGGVDGPCLEVRATLAPRDSVACGLRLVRAGDGAPVATIRWRPGGEDGDGRLEVEGRSWPLDLAPDRPPEPGVGEARPEVTRFPAPLPADGVLELRLFWDRSLLELFARDGRDVCTRVLAAEGEPVAVEAFAEGGTARLVRLRAWELEEIW